MIDKKAISIFILLFLFLITGFGWFISVQTLSQENRIPYDNTYSWVEIFHGYEAYLDRRVSYSNVYGTSMEPTFGEGDAVIWVPIDNVAELKVSDIIIYNHPTRPDEGQIAHRVIDITIINGGYRFETKGDNRAESDAETPISAYYVSENDIMGFVIGVLYNVGLA